MWGNHLFCEKDMLFQSFWRRKHKRTSGREVRRRETEKGMQREKGGGAGSCYAQGVPANEATAGGRKRKNLRERPQLGDWRGKE